MWQEIISSLLTGLATIVTAVGSVMLARSRQIQADLAKLQAEHAELEAKHRQWRIEALRHINALEKTAIKAGISVPDRPDELL